MKKPLWLVTGGAGFIGSNIVEALLKKGEKVRVLDNFSTGKPQHIAAFRNKIDLVRGDIRNPAHCRKAVKGASYVLHQAAIRSVPKSMDRPADTHDANATGTLNMLIAARDARKVRRFVYASSSSAYGDQNKFPQKIEYKPQPMSPYAAQKLMGEHYAILFSKTMGLETISLRYFNVFGPRQDPESKYSAVIPGFMSAAYLGRPLEMHWDGKQSRDFTHVFDVVQANLKAAKSRHGVSEAFNVANGKTFSMLDLQHGIEKIVGRKLERIHFPRRQGDIRRTWADIGPTRRKLGYKPVMTFEKGLLNTWKYFETTYFSKKHGKGKK